MLVAISALLMAAHLWSVGFASFAPFWVIGCEIADARQPDRWWGRYGRRIASRCIWGLLVGALLGIVLGWLTWRPELAYRLEMLGSRVWFGVVEVVFSFILICIHRVWWGYRPVGRRSECWIRSLILFIAGTNLIYHFPVLFEILAETGDVLDQRQEAVDSQTFRSLIVRAEVISQVAHFWLTTAIVGSVSCLILIDQKSASSDNAGAIRAGRIGGWVLLIGSLAQLPVGFWVTSATRRMDQHQLTDPYSIKSWILLGVIVLTLGLAHHATIQISRPGKRVIGLAMHTLLLLILMCFISRTE